MKGGRARESEPTPSHPTPTTLLLLLLKERVLLPIHPHTAPEGVDARVWTAGHVIGITAVDDDAEWLVVVVDESVAEHVLSVVAVVQSVEAR